jgi:uncharacterized repeat protein (TIGR01451 family)
VFVIQLGANGQFDSENDETDNDDLLVFVRLPGGADLALTKSASPDPAQVGSALTYTLTATNNGPAPATGVTVTDTLPSGATFDSATANQGSCDHAGGVVTCALGSLASGASATVTIGVLPTASAVVTNTATVTASESDPQPSSNTATAITTVNPAGKLEVLPRALRFPFTRVNQTRTLRLIVNNGGMGTLTGNVDAGTLAAPFTVSSGAGPFTLGPRRSMTVTVQFTPIVRGAFTDTLIITSSDPEPSRQQVEVTVTGRGR